MENIFSGFETSSLITETNNFIQAIGPYVVLIIGIILGFTILSFLINAITGRKNNVLEEEEYNDDLDDWY